MWAVCNAATARYFIISSVLPVHFQTQYLQATMRGGGGALAFCSCSVGQYAGGHSHFAAAAFANILGGGGGGRGQSLFAAARWPICCYDSGESGIFFFTFFEIVYHDQFDNLSCTAC